MLDNRRSFRIKIGFTILFAVIVACAAIPINDTSVETFLIRNVNLGNDSQSGDNSTFKNLYVIKTLVYEVGILTDANENDTSYEDQERIDLTFFNTHANDSRLDLSKLLLPVRTDDSG